MTIAEFNKKNKNRLKIVRVKRHKDRGKHYEVRIVWYADTVAYDLYPEIRQYATSLAGKVLVDMEEAIDIDLVVDYLLKKEKDNE